MEEYIKDKPAAERLWEYIFSSLKQKPIQMQTVRRDNSSGCWFSAFTINGCIYIESLKEVSDRHSSKVMKPRRINESDFIKVFFYYEKWKRNEIQRTEILWRTNSQNISYIFALITCFNKA